MKWGVVSTQDTDGNMLTHILPIVPVDGFSTELEARLFRLKCLASGSPVLTDENDIIIATFFGHTLSKSCICGPSPKESDHGCWIHRAAN